MKKLLTFLSCLIGLNVIVIHTQAQVIIQADAVVGSSSDFLQVNALVDADASTYAYLSASVSVLSTSFLTCSFPQMGKAGDIISLDIQGTGGLLSTSLLNNLTIRLYDENDINVATASGSTLLNLNLALGASNVYTLSYMTDATASFNIKKVQLEISSLLLLQLMDEFRVYNFNLQTPCPPVYATSVHSSSGNVSNATRAINADHTDFATLNVLLAIPPLLPVEAALDLSFSTQGIAGEYVAFTVGEASTLLSVAVLQKVKIEVFDATGNSVAFKNSFDLADLRLLAGSTDKYYLGFTTPAGSYNIARLKITLGGISVLNSLRVYNAMHFKQSPAPVVIQSASTNVCSGSTVALTATAPESTSILWSNGSTADAISVDAGIYHFKASDSHGCVSTSAAITILSLTLPTVTIDNGATADFCSNTDVTLTATPSSGATVLWSNGATTNDITVNAGGSYTVMATASNGCKASAVIAVTAVTVPQVTELISHVTCKGDANGSIALTPVDGAASYTYAWSNSSALTSIDHLTPGVYTVDIEEASTSCIAHIEYAIQEPDLLSLGGTAFNETCVGGDGRIQLTVNGGTAPYQYNYPAINDNNFLGLAPAVYTVKVTDKNSCQDTETFTVTAANCSAALNIHNVLTPNNDGLNEVLIIEGIENYPNSNLQVFDKWGDVVFTSDHYDNTWSGKNSRDSNPLPSGTYYYILKLNANQVPNGQSDYTGFVLVQ